MYVKGRKSSSRRVTALEGDIPVPRGVDPTTYYPSTYDSDKIANYGSKSIGYDPGQKNLIDSRVPQGDYQPSSYSQAPDARLQTSDAYDVQTATRTNANNISVYSINMSATTLAVSAGAIRGAASLLIQKDSVSEAAMVGGSLAVFEYFSSSVISFLPLTPLWSFLGSWSSAAVASALNGLLVSFYLRSYEPKLGGFFREFLFSMASCVVAQMLFPTISSIVLQ